MISHSEIRGAVKTTLQADASVYAVIDKAGWYNLAAPKAIRSPAIVIGAISQPLVGVSGNSRRQTRFDDPITVSVVVLCEKHDIDTADELLSDAYGKVYDCLCDEKTLGITGLHANVSQINTSALPGIGDNVVGAEIVLSCTYDI